MAPTFLLYDLKGVYNYGCEAIVRGTAKLLFELWPDAQILYSSFPWVDDARRLSGSHVKVIPRLRWPFNTFSNARLSPWRALSFVGGRAGSGAARLLAERTEILKTCTAVLSLGGDLYTPTLSAPGYPQDLVQSAEVVLGASKPLVLWAASVGPFPQGSAAEVLMRKHLGRLDLITSREPLTTSYLRSLEVKDVVPCADPAFALASEGPYRPQRVSPLKIAINLSPLSAQHQGCPLASAAAQQAITLAKLSDALDADLLLIPHVVCSFSKNDDDRQYLSIVHEALPPQVRRRVTLVSNDLGYLGTKHLLRQCSFAICARMHCAINAISERIPTILLSYSQKAAGMATYIYGDSSWALPSSDFNGDSLIPLVATKLGQYESIVNRINSRYPDILTDARRSTAALHALLCKTSNAVS